MQDINVVMLVGRLTKDPEVSYTQNQKCVAKFSIAVNGYNQEQVYFFEITCFGKLAEIAGQYAKKGKQVAVQGQLNQSRYQTQDGRNISKIGILASTVQLLGKKEEGQRTNSRQPSQPVQQDQGQFEDFDGENPFNEF